MLYPTELRAQPFIMKHLRDQSRRRINLLLLVFDTAGMNEAEARLARPANRSLWRKTQFANLIRYVPSGTFFARIRVGGKLIRRSLKTDFLPVAKLRLADLEKRERRLASSDREVGKGRMTFEDAARIHLERVDGKPGIKPRTRDYHRQQLKALFRSWPGLPGMMLRDLSKTGCLTWAGRFRAKASASTFNHTLGILRQLVELGIEHGARYDNPAKAVSRGGEAEGT